MSSNKVIVFILLLVFHSCGKKNEKNHELLETSAIIQSINSSRYQEALDLVENKLAKDGNNADLLYWKSQALIGLSGIDIYKLFPIVQGQFFDVAINEWAEIDRFNRRADNLGNLAIFGDDQGAISIGQLDQYKKELIALESLEKFPFSLVKIDHESGPYSCQIIFEITSPYFLTKNALKFYLPFESEMCLNELFMKDPLNDPYARSSFFFSVYFEAKNIINHEIDEREKQFKQKKMYKMAMAIYNALPMFRKIPSYSDEHNDQIKKALKILDGLYGADRPEGHLEKNARMQTSVVSSFLILGSLKNIMDFQTIYDLQSIFCSLKEKEAIQYYPSIRLGLYYFLRSLRDTDYMKKNKVSFQQFAQAIEQMPEEMNVEQKMALTYKIIMAKSQYCKGSSANPFP